MNQKMVCPSNLPGDNNNPNSPNYVEPRFDREDVVKNVLQELAEKHILEELIYDIGESAYALRLLMRNEPFNKAAHQKLTLLVNQASRVERLLDKYVDHMNGLLQSCKNVRNISSDPFESRIEDMSILEAALGQGKEP